MSTRSILGWVACVPADLLTSQSQTLAALVASAVRAEELNLASVGRRMAGPLLWANSTGSTPRRGRNVPEERLLRRLKGLPPSDRETILADRGFGRAEWAADRHELKLGEQVRIKPAVIVACARYPYVLGKAPYQGRASLTSCSTCNTARTLGLHATW